jgi:hypothetical protein
MNIIYFHSHKFDIKVDFDNTISDLRRLGLACLSDLSSLGQARIESDMALRPYTDRPKIWGLA